MCRLSNLAIIRAVMNGKMCYDAERRAVKLCDGIYYFLDSLVESINDLSFMSTVITWSFWILGRGPDLV
jgi:hypothetical protein